MSKPHIYVNRDARYPVMKHTADGDYHLEGYVRCLNLVRYMTQCPFNDVMSRGEYAMAKSLAIRLHHGYATGHLVREWVGNDAVTLKQIYDSVKRTYPHLTLYAVTNLKLVHIFMPNGLYGDTIKPHLKKEC